MKKAKKLPQGRLILVVEKITTITYLLRLNKISLISSLKSVINTAIIAMNKFKNSIMDSYIISSTHTPNLTAKKKARLQRAELLAYYIGIFFFPISHQNEKG